MQGLPSCMVCWKKMVWFQSWNPDDLGRLSLTNMADAAKLTETMMIPKKLWLWCPKRWIFVEKTSAQICGEDSLPSEPGDFPLPRKIGGYLLLCNLAILIYPNHFKTVYFQLLWMPSVSPHLPLLTLRIRPIREIRFRMRTSWGELQTRVWQSLCQSHDKKHLYYMGVKAPYSKPGGKQ